MPPPPQEAIASGRLEQARSALVEARRHWGERGDPAALAAWFAGIAYVDWLGGCYGAALKDAGYARRVAESDLASVALATRVIGCIQVERGLFEIGTRWLAEAAGASPAARADLGLALSEGGHADGLDQSRLAVAEARGAEERAWTGAKLARALARCSLVEEATLELAAAGGGSGFAWVQLGLALAEVALAGGAAAAALEAAERHQARLEEAGVRSHLGDALLIRAAALGALGRDQEQAEVRSEIRDLALGLGADRLLKRLG